MVSRKLSGLEIFKLLNGFLLECDSPKEKFKKKSFFKWVEWRKTFFQLYFRYAFSEILILCVILNL